VSVANDSAPADVPRRNVKKNRRKNCRQSDDCDASVASSSTVGDCSSVHVELRHTQQWLLRQMQTGLATAAPSRFSFVVFQWSKRSNVVKATDLHGAARFSFCWYPLVEAERAFGQKCFSVPV